MNIIKVEVKKGMKSLLIWSLVCSLLVILFMAMFPSMKDSGMQELVNTKMDAMPKAILEAFNLEDIPDFSKLNEYFAYVFQYIVMAGAIYAGLLGAKALIEEESEGTIEFLYSKPVSRSKIVTSKIISSFILFYVFVMIMGISTMVMSLIVKPQDLAIIDVIIDMKLLFSGFFLVGIVFMAIGFLVSVGVPHLRLATPVSIGIFFITYLLGVFSGMIDSLKFLKYLSPFNYGVPAKLIKDGFDVTNIILSLLITVVCISITYVIYRKKDLII